MPGNRFVTQTKSKILQVTLCLFYLCTLSHALFCSTYCTYQFDGSSLVPQCTDENSTSCTQCDENLFSLTSGECQSHQKYNETLHTTDLDPEKGSLPDPLTAWNSLNGNYQITQQAGLYDMVQFFSAAAPPMGGDDRIYRQFSGLPAHYAIRLRFSILFEPTSTNFQFNYYLDSSRYTYDYLNSFPESISGGGGIVTSELLQHKDDALTVAFEASSLAVGQWVGVRQVLLFLSKCADGCSLCLSKDLCLTCGGLINGSQSYLLENDGQCYTDCPLGFYQTQNASTLQFQCASCNPLCLSCDISADNCSICQFEGVYQSFLLNQTCHTTCPNGYSKNYTSHQCTCDTTNGKYLDSTSNCAACSPQCLTCFGPTASECYTCSETFFLVNGTYRCATTCPSNQFIDSIVGVSARQCYLCANSCSTCEGKSTNCMSCSSLTPIKFLHQNKCVSECPQGYEADQHSHSCIACAPFFYSYSQLCLQQCPKDFVEDSVSRSCIHLSETDFTYEVNLIQIKVLFGGKNLIVRATFQSEDQIDEKSRTWILTQAYFNIFLNVDEKDFQISGVKTLTNQQVEFLLVKPETLSEQSSVRINFGKQLKSVSNITYAQNSSAFSVKHNPVFLKSLYQSSSTIYLKIALIPAFLMIFGLAFYLFKNSYSLTVQLIRVFQFVGLSTTLTYPTPQATYFFQKSLNFFNFRFIPNVYSIFVDPFEAEFLPQYFLGYRFSFGDMEFLRMTANWIVLGLVMVLVVLTCKYLTSVRLKRRVWMMRLFFDLAEYPMWFAYFSNLAFTLHNADVLSENLVRILIAHVISYIWVVFSLWRQFKRVRLIEAKQQSQSSNSQPSQFSWRNIEPSFLNVVICSLLLTLSHVLPLLFLTILSMFVIAMIPMRLGWESRKHKKNPQECAYEKIQSMRSVLCSVLPLIAILIVILSVMSQEQIKQSASIAIQLVVFYFLTVLAIFISVYLRKNKPSRFFEEQMQSQESKDQKKWDSKSLMSNQQRNTLAPKTGMIRPLQSRTEFDSEFSGDSDVTSSIRSERDGRIFESTKPIETKFREKTSDRYEYEQMSKTQVVSSEAERKGTEGLIQNNEVLSVKHHKIAPQKRVKRSKLTPNNSLVIVQNKSDSNKNQQKQQEDRKQISSPRQSTDSKEID